MELYFNKEHRDTLLITPFVSSWIGEAGGDDLWDNDERIRRAGWAAWAVDALVSVSGYREYSALALDGKFYDPKGTGELKARPHLEIPARILGQSDPEFPKRLSLMGNALGFPWWLYSEVVATKRALFHRPAGSIEPLEELLIPRSAQLRKGLTLFRDASRAQWSSIEEHLVISDGDGLVGDACGNFTSEEINSYLPGAGQLGLEIKFETKLRTSNGVWAARRVGVWQIQGNSGGKPFALGVITPRLTANSTLNDPMFAPDKEALGAVLVRTLVLRRLATKYLDIPGAVQHHKIGVNAPSLKEYVTRNRRSTVKAYLKGIVSKPGEKTPQASARAAVAFLQVYPDRETAWKALGSWAGDQYTLIVSRETFLNAHARASLMVQRVEDPERDDINLLLPLAWDDRGRVVRVTFAKGPGGA